MKAFAAIGLWGTLLVAPTAVHANNHTSQSSATSAAAMIQGEIRKVDKEAKKLTIRHGAITNLDMPPMTMTFQVQDPTVLDQVRVGDKVRFVADKKDGAFIVTKVEADR